MSKLSLIKKYKPLQALMGLLTPIVALIINFTNTVPTDWKETIVFKVCILTVIAFGGALLFIFLLEWLKDKPNIIRFSGFGMAIIFISISIASVFMKPKSKKESERDLVSISNTSNQNSLVTDSNNDMKFDLSNSKNLVIGNGNVIGVNGDITYLINKRPQRKLDNRDLKEILDSIHSKETTIRINYPSGDFEALNYGDEVFDRLTELDYSSLVKCSIPASENYFEKKRFTVKSVNEPYNIIDVIINPQN